MIEIRTMSEKDRKREEDLMVSFPEFIDPTLRRKIFRKYLGGMAIHLISIQTPGLTVREVNALIDCELELQGII
jgi:hypothetical protein